MLSALIHNPFFQMALWACLLSSIAGGVIGSFVVIKRISFIAGSISHSILGGMGVCVWLQRVHGLTFLDPIWGAFAAAILSAQILGIVHLHYKQREDAIIAAIWSTGMAIGMIFISMTPGTNVELLDYLFGNILWIEAKDLIRLAALNGIILVSVALYYRKFIAVCFDEEQAILQGIHIKKVYLSLLTLVALSIVLLMQIIGTILVIAMLTIPATLASLFTNRLKVMICIAILLSALFSISGLFTSYTLNLPPAATIALFSAICYAIALCIRKKKFTTNPNRSVI